MFELQVPLLETVARTLVVYVLVLVGLRLAGKREVGQMTPFVGGFVIETRHSGAPEQVWSTVGEKACISHAEFSSYVEGNATATAVEVRSPFRLRRGVERDELSGISGGVVSPPQSVQYIRSAALKMHLEALAPAEATTSGRLL